MRWFQLAFTEDDPGRFDPQFWFDYFKEIHADGVCLSAGGGIAFYPTKIPYHGRSANLGNEDPFGIMVEGCKALDMAVIARIDPHAMNQQTFNAHPEWAACGADGKPRKHWVASDLYLTCPYGAYNFELITAVIEEINAAYPVDAFFGNRWKWLGLCYCEFCRKEYFSATGKSIPLTDDPVDPSARNWHRWAQQRTLHLIDVWNQAIEKRNPNGFFISGSDRRGIEDYNGMEFGDRQRLLFCDRQARSEARRYFTSGQRIWNSGRFTKELRAFMWQKPVGNIISVGVEEQYRWKDSVQAGPEVRLWAADAIAQGGRPWITKFNAKPRDTRWMPVVSDLYQWLHRNEKYLRNESNLADVGLLLSNRTATYLGGLERRAELEGHYRGFYQALLESRIPFDVVEDSFLDAGHLGRFKVLVLPNAAMLSARQCAQLREYVYGGGRIVATYLTSLYDEEGTQLSDFGLADLFGCHFDGGYDSRLQNSYLSLRAPHTSLERLKDVRRIIGPVQRVHVRLDGRSEVPVTFVPSYPDLPMERVFTDTIETEIPMVLCREVGDGRVAYLPMDIDRTFDELCHADHLALLRGIIDWASGGDYPMAISGPGLVDVAYWRQKSSFAAHLVNLNNPMTMRGSVREFIQTGPYDVQLRVPGDKEIVSVRLLESEGPAKYRREGEKVSVRVPQIRSHEVVAIDVK